MRKRKKRGRPKKRKPITFQINDRKVDKKKYYLWYYDDQLEVKVIPMGYLTYSHAKLTAMAQFGPEVLKDLYISRGDMVKRNKWAFGTRFFPVNGRKVLVRKYLYPPEYFYSKNRRKRFTAHLHRAANKYKDKERNEKYVEFILMKAYGTTIGI